MNNNKTIEVENIQLNTGQKLIEINNNSKGSIKNSRRKINKNNKLIKNHSVKQYNNSIYSLITNNKNTTSINNKILTISTKKLLTKPKTYNFFSQDKYFNNNINNNYRNNATSIDIQQLNTQRKPIKNYGFKNKTIQESELVNGALIYLQNEYFKRNKKNIKDNHIINISGITMRELKHKFKIFDNNINVVNKNNYKVPYDYKKIGKQFGEDSFISLNSTSTGVFLLNNNSNYGDEISSIDNNNNSNNIFQKEMNRIINFNKKLKSIKKHKEKSNEKNKNNLGNNIGVNKYNKNMKKSLSQPNFYNNKNIKMFRNKDKIISNKKYKSVCINNKKIVCNSSNFNKNENKDKLDFSRNINLNYNINSQQIKKQNISNENIIINKKINHKNILENSQEEKNFQKMKKEKINKKKNEYENRTINQSDETKFRFVLDKFTKKAKERPKKFSKKKEEEKCNKNKSKENSKNINISIKKENESFFNEGLNSESLCDNKILKEKNSQKKEIKLLDIEKLDLSTIQKKDDSNINTNNGNKINNNLKEENDIIVKKMSFETVSCSGNAIDDENDIKVKKNIPLNISPIIKIKDKKNQFLLDNNLDIIGDSKDLNMDINKNINVNETDELIKSIEQENKTSNNNIDSILSQTHDKPKFFKYKEKK